MLAGVLEGLEGELEEVPLVVVPQEVRPPSEMRDVGDDFVGPVERPGVFHADAVGHVRVQHEIEHEVERVAVPEIVIEV